MPRSVRRGFGRLGRRQSPSTATAMLPFANVEWHHGAHGTLPHGHHGAASGPGLSEAASWLPAMASATALCHRARIHQEIGWERQTDASGVAVLVYSDHIDNPVLEALGRFAGRVPAARCSSIRRATCCAPPGRRSSAAGVRGQRGAPAARRQSHTRELCQRQCAGDARFAAGNSSWPRCSPRTSSARPDLRDFALGHAGWHRDPLERELSLAARWHCD
jgi:hypothetical protein